MDSKIGIFIPTYNRSILIKECIDSLLIQSYTNIQIFIVDNASTDNTFDVVTSIKDDRVNYFRNDLNIGALGNFNRCVAIALDAKIDFFTIYHSDDIYSKKIIEEEYNFLKSDSKIGAVFTRMNSIDQNDNCLMGQRTIFNNSTLTHEFLINGTPLFCPTFMCRTEIFRVVDPFSKDYVYFGDTEFYLRLSKSFNIGLISAPLAFYRKSIAQESYIQQANLNGLTEEHTYVLNNVLKETSDTNLIKSYKRRVSKEYLFYSIEAIMKDKSVDFIDDKIRISMNYKLFSIFNKYGISQRIIKYRLYLLIKIVMVLKDKL